MSHDIPEHWTDLLMALLLRTLADWQEICRANDG
jgi:hypothetical protein